MFYMGPGIVKQKESLTFVTLVFLALKGGQGVNRPESKTDLMSSPLLHWHFTICGFSPFPILINWLRWETDQLNSNSPLKIDSALTKNAVSLEGKWFSIDNFLHSKLINWCWVASSAWLGLRLGVLLTWDQPPLYYQTISCPTNDDWPLLTICSPHHHHLPWELTDQLPHNLPRLCFVIEKSFLCVFMLGASEPCSIVAVIARGGYLWHNFIRL